VTPATFDQSTADNLGRRSSVVAIARTALLGSYRTGLPRRPPTVTGVDFILVKGGRIAALYTFLDPHDPISGVAGEPHRD